MELNMCSSGRGGAGMPPGCGDALDAALAGMGLAAFRPGQRETVESVLAGQETLAVMATGAGKSLCYQLPARLLDGVTVVVTPLLALMRDQVAHAAARGVAAVALSSVDGAAERAQKLAAVAHGQYRVVLAAPEGLRSPAVLRALRHAGVALLCVDEAHCISAWGHDFRPDYGRLGVLRQALGAPRLLALTATATPVVQQDIVRGLWMQAPRLILAGCDRPNLALAVEEVRGQGAKRSLVTQHVRQALAGPGCVIVYCATRSSTVEVARGLEGDGVAVRAYHAGLAAQEREEACRAWEDGSARVMVATSAFGMGVDKPDVRLVLHHAVPRSPEAYWQEVGRAGRDGAPARGVLLLDGRDLWLARQRLFASTPDAAAVVRAWAALRQAARGDGYVAAGLEEAGRVAAGVVGWAARACVAHLAAQGALELSAAGVWLVPPAHGNAAARPAVDAQLLDAQRAQEEARLGAMVHYARHARCRRAFLVEYFSQVAPPPCGACDACNAGALQQPEPPLALTFQIILSCVARLLGGYGRARVVEVLLGSQSQALVRLGLQRQSTFGRLRGMGRAQVQACIQALETAGLLHSVGATYPTLDLTPQGDEAMRTGVFPPMRLAGITTAAQPPRRCGVAPAPAAAPATLEARLRGVPGEVLEERLVRALVLLRPRTLEELAHVPGFGRARCRRVGPAVLEIIQNG